MPRASRTAIARSLIPESISMLMLAVFAISLSRLSTWVPSGLVSYDCGGEEPLCFEALAFGASPLCADL